MILYHNREVRVWRRVGGPGSKEKRKQIIKLRRVCIGNSKPRKGLDVGTPKRQSVKQWKRDDSEEKMVSSKQGDSPNNIKMYVQGERGG